MNRTDIINRLIGRQGYKSYLEIGVRNPKDNFDKIDCHDKRGVDPSVSHPDVMRMTSLEYWSKKGRRKMFDVVFVDGDHHYEPVLTDILEGLKALKKGGVVVVHDCHPVSGESTAPVKPAGGGAWCGQVNKAFEKAAGMPGNFGIIINCDHGVGLIRNGSGPSVRRAIWKPEELDAALDYLLHP